MGFHIRQAVILSFLYPALDTAEADRPHCTALLRRTRDWEDIPLIRPGVFAELI